MKFISVKTVADSPVTQIPSSLYIPENAIGVLEPIDGKSFYVRLKAEYKEALPFGVKDIIFVKDQSNELILWENKP
jgi:hypothetical protein